MTAITVGAGRRSSRGRRVEWDGTPKGLRDLLSARPAAADAWWSPHLWRDDKRGVDRWQSCAAIAIDCDYQDGNGKHAALPGEVARVLLSASLPGNLYHLSPRGCRIVFVPSEPITDRVQAVAAAAGACTIVDLAIHDLGIAADTTGKTGLVVDRGASCDLARLFFAPRALVDGHQREDDVAMPSAEPVDAAELEGRALVAPPPPIAAPTRNGEARARVSTASGSADLDAAAARWNSDHPLELPRPGMGDCPACGGKGGFGALPDRPGKWFCWHATHPDTVGHKTDRGHFGDALDLEAHATGRERIAILRDGRYLAPICGATTKAGKICAATELLASGRCRVHQGSPARDRAGEDRAGATTTGVDSDPDPPTDDGSAFLTTRSFASAVAAVRHNVADVLEGRSLCLDEMLGCPALDNAQVTDSDVSRVRFLVEQRIAGARTAKGALKPCVLSCDDVRAAIVMVAEERRRHPVREYLSSLIWDGTPRIERVPAEVLRADDNPLNRAILHRWFLSAVARPMKPGCKVDTILVLVGEQGALKSTALRTLAGPEWFSDTPIDVHNKDSFASLQRTWITEWGELESLRRARDAEAVKGFLSSSVDRYRPPYGRFDATVERTSVIVGSTNRREFLTDETGNRRWWPIVVGRIDIDRLAEWRDQLWAEAMADLAAGEQWWLTTDEETDIAPRQDGHSVEDAWTADVLAWVGGRLKPSTTAEVIAGALEKKLAEWTRGDEMRVAAILTRAGYRKRKTSDGSRREWVRS